MSAVVVAVLMGLVGLARGEAFPNGFPKDKEFFPIAVWLQAPANAAKYKAIGINTYVGLWRGPTQQQLDQLKQAGMLLVCSQNDVALNDKNSKVIVGWMHGDEPDNAQAIPGKSGYGPPIPPQRIIDSYEKIRQNDPTRPVLLNLGQAVAWDNYIGRGVRRNHPEDYPEYVKGCDIASFDIYPVTHESREIAGKLQYVAIGTARLKQWAGPDRRVWACIGCTHISNPDLKPTVEQVRSEVWLALTNGASGLIYFSHQFKPRFIEAGILADPEMAQGINSINARVSALAPALNSANVEAMVRCDNPSICVLARRVGNEAYVLTVSKSGSPQQARFTFLSSRPDQAQVLDETRMIKVEQGGFGDAYKPYQVHLYQLRLSNGE